MKEFAERCKIIANCPIKIFIASYSSRYWYPYRLQSAGRAQQWARDSSLELIVDSEIGNEEIGNMETLDRAADLNADFVIPADVLHDQDATTESIHDFLGTYADHRCTSTVVIPLQPPYETHYRELQGFSHYCLGGIAKADPKRQIREIKRFRQEAGFNVYAHGLGLGGSLELVRTLRDEPMLLDSLDLSTTEQMASKNKIADKSWNQRDFEYPRGESSSTIRASYASAMALQLNYMLSPLCDDIDSEYRQSTLSEMDQ